MVLFPPPFYFAFDISILLSYIQNNFSYELARPIMGTIFLVILLLSIVFFAKFLYCTYNHVYNYNTFVIAISLSSHVGVPTYSAIEI